MEMEAAGVLSQVREWGMPFYCVKSVTDLADESFRIDLNAARRHGVSVRWTPGVNRQAVAELTVCFMIALCRSVVALEYRSDERRLACRVEVGRLSGECCRHRWLSPAGERTDRRDQYISALHQGAHRFWP